jgi:RNA polymerase sigma-70 factor (ECF subfamily)
MTEDDELVSAAAAGSTDAVGALFDAYWLVAWRAAHAVTGRADLADDAAQDAFIKAIRSLPGFEHGRPFGPWIAKIAVNRARDLLRGERRRPASSLDGQAIEAPDPAHAHELLDAVAALPPERREAVVLRHVLGFGVSEVAAIVGAPEGTVASRLARGLAQLRQTTEAEHA